MRNSNQKYQTWFPNTPRLRIAYSRVSGQGFPHDPGKHSRIIRAGILAASGQAFSLYPGKARRLMNDILIVPQRR